MFYFQGNEQDVAFIPYSFAILQLEDRSRASTSMVHLARCGSPCRKYYTVYDRQRLRIGFALARHGPKKLTSAQQLDQGLKMSSIVGGLPLTVATDTRRKHP